MDYASYYPQLKILKGTRLKKATVDRIEVNEPVVCLGFKRLSVVLGNKYVKYTFYINIREVHFTYRLALTAISIGTFGPFRISAFSQIGRSIFNPEDVFTKISRDGPTVLMFLKSSLITIGKNKKFLRKLYFSSPFITMDVSFVIIIPLSDNLSTVASQF